MIQRQKNKYFGYFSIFFLTLLLIGNFRTYLVLGESDLPSFISGDKVIINRSAYDLTLPFTDQRIFPWRNPNRGDMILCYFKKNENKDFWLKRIIGMPGDTIRIKNNKIFINRKQLKYEILKKETFRDYNQNEFGEIIAIESGYGLKHLVTYSETENILSNFGPLVITNGHYFVLGDNRVNSLDSRFLGLVPRQKIFGKYLFRLYRKG
ncbi:MAG: signal peptidase I [Bacteroidales bacterium]|nr:signal peptidase I [Bacteroidales bacterium]